MSCGTGVRTRHLTPGLTKTDGSPCVCEPGTCTDTQTETCQEDSCDLLPPAPAPEPESIGYELMGHILTTSHSFEMGPVPTPAPSTWYPTPAPEVDLNAHKWKVVVLRREIRLAGPPYLAAHPGAFNFTIQPAFADCQEHCQNTDGCAVGGHNSFQDPITISFLYF